MYFHPLAHDPEVLEPHHIQLLAHPALAGLLELCGIGVLERPKYLIRQPSYKDVILQSFRPLKRIFRTERMVTQGPTIVNFNSVILNS